MLFISILLFLLLFCYFLFLKKRLFSLKIIVLSLFVLLILETSVYAYFISQIYVGKGLLLIGNQKVLDALYKIRLIYSVYYCQGKKDYYFATNDETGYAIGRNKATSLYTSNSAGFRAKNEYSLIPAEEKFRIACFGNSFVFCDDVRDDETWEHYLEHGVGNLEVLNFGVGGYGVIQSYLRYLRDGLRFSPHVVFVNMVLSPQQGDNINYLTRVDANLRQADFYTVKASLEDGLLKFESRSVFDIFNPTWRNENIYNKLDFYKENKWLSSKLTSLSNIMLFLKACYIKYRISKMKIFPDSDLPVITLEILKNFSDIVRKNNGILVLVDFYPMETFFPKQIQDFFKTNSGHVKYFNIHDAFFERIEPMNLSGLRGLLKRATYYDEIATKRYLDAKLKILKRHDLLGPTNHYNAWGNKIYADVILNILKENEWLIGDKVFYYNEKSDSFLSHDKDALRKSSKIKSEAN